MLGESVEGLRGCGSLLSRSQTASDFDAAGAPKDRLSSGPSGPGARSREARGRPFSSRAGQARQHRDGAVQHQGAQQGGHEVQVGVGPARPRVRR